MLMLSHRDYLAIEVRIGTVAFLCQIIMNMKKA